MNLSKILKSQKRFESHFINFGNTSVAYKRKMTQKMLLSLMTEIVELLDEIKWKNIVWKDKNKTINYDNLYKEIIDLFIYVTNIFLIWKMDDKIINKMYYEKLNHNIKKYIKGKKCK